MGVKEERITTVQKLSYNIASHVAKRLNKHLGLSARSGNIYSIGNFEGLARSIVLEAAGKDPDIAGYVQHDE